nr:MAG TPA: hypothetical protein [Caudoviricetes sp.]DAW34539.1 MAG TPA: hypothetical protein [Caudoviricetes sp.]
MCFFSSTLFIYIIYYIFHIFTSHIYCVKLHITS